MVEIGKDKSWCASGDDQNRVCRPGLQYTSPASKLRAAQTTTQATHETNTRNIFQNRKKWIYAARAYVRQRKTIVFLGRNDRQLADERAEKEYGTEDR